MTRPWTRTLRVLDRAEKDVEGMFEAFGVTPVSGETA